MYYVIYNAYCVYYTLHVMFTDCITHLSATCIFDYSILHLSYTLTYLHLSYDICLLDQWFSDEALRILRSEP